MMKVKANVSINGCQPGDCVELKDEEAKFLVRRGYAVEIDDKPETKKRKTTKSAPVDVVEEVPAEEVSTDAPADITHPDIKE